MQYRSPRTACRDCLKRLLLYAVLFQHIIKARLNLVFLHARLCLPHHFLNAQPRDIHCPAHPLQLPILFQEPQIAENRIQVGYPQSRIAADEFLRKTQSRIEIRIPIPVFQIKPYRFYHILEYIIRKRLLKGVYIGNVVNAADFLCLIGCHIPPDPFRQLSVIPLNKKRLTDTARSFA